MSAALHTGVWCQFNAPITMQIRKIAALVASATTLISCSNGGSSTDATPIAQATVLSGTTATGAALARASVRITNSVGSSPCEETVIATDSSGAYLCTLKAGETAPFFIIGIDQNGDVPAMASVVTATPNPGERVTANVTPITTAILAEMSNDGDAVSLVTSRSLDASSFSSLVRNVVAQLQPVLSAVSLPTEFDPFQTALTAAVSGSMGNAADQLLDLVKVGTNPATGKQAFFTVDSALPVPLATKDSAGMLLTQVSGTSQTSIAALTQFLPVVAKQFNDCLAAPLDARVLTVDSSKPEEQGGAEVTSFGTACRSIVTDETTSTPTPAFLHNGFKGGQYLFSLVGSSAMTGTTFSVPEIMMFTRGADTASGRDEAVLNIRYADSAGIPGNFLVVAHNIPGSASAEHPSNWWLVGNQDPVEVKVQPLIRRYEQMNPAHTGKFSSYQSGIQFRVNVKGPGSINASNEPLNMARVTGPGLPAGGLVYRRSSSASLQPMDLFNKTGSLTTGLQCGNGTTTNCPNLWVDRTQGLTGAQANVIAPNFVNINWAQPEDGVQGSLMVKGAKYRVELFYGSNTSVADMAFDKTLLSNMIPATIGAMQPWSVIGEKTRAALDPNGALVESQSGLILDWTQNLSALPMISVTGTVDSRGSYGPSKRVMKGASNAVLDHITVNAFNATGYRAFLFTYRTLDDSSKSAVYSYN